MTQEMQPCIVWGWRPGFSLHLDGDWQCPDIWQTCERAHLDSWMVYLSVTGPLVRVLRSQGSPLDTAVYKYQVLFIDVVSSIYLTPRACWLISEDWSSNKGLTLTQEGPSIEKFQQLSNTCLVHVQRRHRSWERGKGTSVHKCVSLLLFFKAIKRFTLQVIVVVTTLHAVFSKSFECKCLQSYI